jgi:hypothetical protein
LSIGKKGKAKGSPGGEAGAGEGSLAPASAKKANAGKAKVAPIPASNVNPDGNTTTATTPGTGSE